MLRRIKYLKLIILKTGGAGSVPGLLLHCCSLLFLLLLAAVPGAFAAEKSIGVIMTGSIPYYNALHKAFIEGLEEGLGAGKAEVIVQKPAPEVMAWTNAARKLVAADVNVIVAYGAPATIAVISETTTIPIVFAGVYDPVAIGATGGNVTGISSKVPVASIIKNLKGISPFTKLGVIFNDSEKDTLRQADEVKNLESQFRFQSHRFNIKRPGDAAKVSGVDALFITTSCAAQQCVDNVIGIARKEKMATATSIGGGEDRGIILTISADPKEQGREAAEAVVKVLRGAKASTIPVGLPTKIAMIINLKEAEALGLKVPFDILTSAAKVLK